MSWTRFGCSATACCRGSNTNHDWEGNMPTVRAFGASVKRVEDPRFLVGRAQYVDALRLPGTVGVAFVRSQHAHARIKSIDASKALAHPGVLRVLTGEEAAKLC